jgi:hypothetical protein
MLYHRHFPSTFQFPNLRRYANVYDHPRGGVGILFKYLNERRHEHACSIPVAPRCYINQCGRLRQYQLVRYAFLVALARNCRKFVQSSLVLSFSVSFGPSFSVSTHSPIFLLCTSLFYCLSVFLFSPTNSLSRSLSLFLSCYV